MLKHNYVLKKHGDPRDFKPALATTIFMDNLVASPSVVAADPWAGKSSHKAVSYHDNEAPGYLWRNWKPRSAKVHKECNTTKAIANNSMCSEGGAGLAPSAVIADVGITVHGARKSENASCSAVNLLHGKWEGLVSSRQQMEYERDQERMQVLREAVCLAADDTVELLQQSLST